MPPQKKTWWESVRWSSLLIIAAVVAFGAAMYLARTLKGEVSVDDATWMVAFLTGVLALGVPLSIRDATRKQKSENAQFYAQEQMRFYAQLDAIYLDIQKLIIQHPFLARPDGPRTADQEDQYQAFAFIVWNFLESIEDYDAELRGREAESRLKITWKCVMKYEAVLHARWFQDPRNEGKFKSEFREKMMCDLKKWGAITAKTSSLSVNHV